MVQRECKVLKIISEMVMKREIEFYQSGLPLGGRLVAFRF